MVEQSGQHSGRRRRGVFGIGGAQWLQAIIHRTGIHFPSQHERSHKGFNRVENYGRIIERIHAHGDRGEAGIVFGFDNDTETIFDETLDFLEAAGVQNATFNILTPYPGTPLYRRLEAEGRILTRIGANITAGKMWCSNRGIWNPKLYRKGIGVPIEDSIPLKAFIKDYPILPQDLWVDPAANIAYTLAFRYHGKIIRCLWKWTSSISSIWDPILKIKHGP